MIKILILLLFFVSCSNVKQSKFAPKLVRNPECLNQNKFIVKEIYDDAIFAKLCPEKFKSYYDDSFDACNDGIKVFMYIDPKSNDYVDHQKVTLDSDKCFVNDGVLVYEDEFDGKMKEMVENMIKQKTGEDVDLGDNVRRVRKVKIIDSIIDKSKS